MSLFRKLITELAERIDPETAEAKKNEQGETLTAYRTRLRSLVDKGCESFYREIYGDRYVDGWANHHREAINWHWDGRLGFLKIAERQGVLESEIKAGDITREEFQTLLDAFIKEHKAKYLAYFPIWSRGHAKCVDENTQVLMADGTRKAIKNVFIGDKVLSFDRTSGRLIEQKVKGKWEAGIKKCVTVKTRTGWELTATTDHAVLTFDGWKTVGELTEQDRIASPRRIPTGSKDIFTTDEECRLLAYFLAEGNTTYCGKTLSANITNSDSVIVDDAIKCAASLGYEGSRSSTSKYRVCFRHGIRDWIRKHNLDGKKATDKRIPEWVYRLPLPQIEQFVAAFFDTDGYVGQEAAGIGLANSALIDDLRYLLLQLAGVTKKYFKTNNTHGSWALELDRECLRRFGSLPLLLKKEKWQVLLSKNRYSLIDTYPQSVTIDLPKGLNRRLRHLLNWKPTYASKRITRQKIRRALTVCSLPHWEWLEQADVLWDEVVSVVDAGERNTYDISVSNTENFIADGLVTHNSTHAEHLVVTDAMLSWAFDQPGFCLYVCREKTKVIEHVSNIEELLSSPKVKEYCPLLSQVQVNDETGQKRQWTGRFLHTAAGYVVKGASTDSAQAGSRIKDTRVTFMVLDDVDGREKSLVISENRYNRISNELLPMRQWNTLVFWAQNLINEYTVMYSVYKQRRQMLTNRKPTQPVPAVIDLKAEQRTVDGIVKMVYISGEPTWHAWDADRIQDEMDSEGYDAFLRECQHEVEGKKEGRVFPRYDDGIHVITESEFAAVYGVRKPPRSWYKYFAHDWARTKTEFHANVAFWSAVSPQNAKRPGFFFIYDPMSFPEDTMPDTCAVRFLNTLQPSIYVQGTEYTWEELIQQTLLRENLERHITDTTKLIEARRTVLARIIPQYLRGYQTADGKKVEGLLDSHSVKKMRFSHDRDDINRIYNQTYGFRFDPCNPGEKGGVSQINELMRVDYTHEHPFKPGVFGYTRFFIIVPDEKADRDEISPVKDLHDHDLLRHQMINRRTLPAKLTEAGEVNIDTYEKANDDFGQSLQFLFFDNAPFNEPLTREEKTEEVMRHEAPELSVDVIEALPDSPQKGQAVQARLQKIKEVQAGLIRGEGRFKNPMKRVRRNY